jgi:hypothetical protein
VKLGACVGDGLSTFIDILADAGTVFFKRCSTHIGPISPLNMFEVLVAV